MNCRRFAFAVLATMPICLTAAHGQQAEQESPGSPAAGDERTFEQSKQKALAWLDDYLRVQVLFEPEHLQAIRQTVAEMKPEELKQWIEDTHDLRTDLESPEWQQTQAWIREFLQVQAIHSDQEIAEFRAKAAKMSPTELRSLLFDLDQRRQQLSSAREGWERARQATSAAMQPMSRPAPTGSFQTNPKAPATFGQTYVAPVTRRAYRYSRPLVTSLDVARETVYRSIFPGRYW